MVNNVPAGKETLGNVSLSSIVPKLTSLELVRAAYDISADLLGVKTH